ncbi:MAG: N-acetyl-gamma-glutamyl-phosphate/N-acetyl-gamma-aminoadipyl-phosphate reductase [Chloroflexi bacterium ADurb.Bin325]|nr:MAG: N-acetyl-gamma-glutamyl-phosphate/N-acetyl-gamma-aminoadipyl-phosphate reductase [Chloroflexi bacterium ADurb.Bin325]
MTVPHVASPDPQASRGAQPGVVVSIVGGSGYGGGELLRLLTGHPCVTVAQVTSESHTGDYVHSLHPNLRPVGRRQAMRFTSLSELAPCDVLFLALPHGEAQRRIEQFASLAPTIVDLSADFRISDPAEYARIYGQPHAAAEWLPRFAYGLPEANRAAIRAGRHVSGVGCNATAANLALLPLVRAGLLRTDRPIIVDVKAGSSEGGASASAASHHPERAGAVRSFAPTGHRHEAEARRVLGREDVYLSVTSIELVRGVLATAHAWVEPGLAEKDLWRAYRAAYAAEPFIRIVHERGGIYRHPEPKLLAGTNLADVGWELDPATGRLVALAALDNLGKGAAGTAVQCMNLMLGWDETLGLDACGLHPI